MQSSNLSLAISSLPMTFSAFFYQERLYVLPQPGTASAAHGPAVSPVCRDSAGCWVSKAINTELRKKSRNDLRGVSGDNMYYIDSLRRTDSCDQDSYRNEVNRSSRYTTNTVLMYVLLVCYRTIRCLCSILDNDCFLLNSRDQARP